jgi:integral membrane protein (TIGR01906 family)
VLAIALAVAGLVVLALAYAGPGTYTDIATHEGFARVDFRERDGSRRTMQLSELVGIHDGWVSYVTGHGDPPGGTTLPDFFTADEQAHMTDVRHVFIGFELAALTAVGIAVVLVMRTAKRSRVAALLLLRDAAIAACVGTAIIAVGAAVAFDRLFLLFHEILFPQGNFLFPADSNLLAMYPDPYWYGVTLRVGLTFVAVMAVIAIASAATLRRARR